MSYLVQATNQNKLYDFLPVLLLVDTDERLILTDRTHEEMVTVLFPSFSCREPKTLALTHFAKASSARCVPDISEPWSGVNLRKPQSISQTNETNIFS